MVGNTRARLPLAPWTCAVVGIALAAVVVVGFGPPGQLLPRVTVCQLGPEIGTYTIWTPNGPLNKPENTTVSAFSVPGASNYIFTSGSLTVGVTPPDEDGGGWGEGNYSAGIALLGTLNNWTFYRATNASVIGSTSNPCTQPYVAQLGLDPFPTCGGFVTIPLENNSNDVLEPHVWNGLRGPNDSSSEPPSCPEATPGTQVWFDTSFYYGGTGNSAPVTLNLCGKVGS